MPSWWLSSMFEVIPISERKRLHIKIDPSLQKYFEWAEHKLGRTIRRRTSSAITIFKLVSKPEFVFMDSELAKMAPAQLAGRQMVRTMVSETTSNSRFRRSRTSIRETGGGGALSGVLTLQAVCTLARMKVSTAWSHLCVSLNWTWSSVFLV